MVDAGTVAVSLPWLRCTSGTLFAPRKMDGPARVAVATDFIPGFDPASIASGHDVACINRDEVQPEVLTRGQRAMRTRAVGMELDSRSLMPVIEADVAISTRRTSITGLYTSDQCCAWRH